MMCFGLLLLFTNSVLAASSATINQQSINEFLVPDRNPDINLDYVFELTGTTNIYILNVQQILSDLSTDTELRSQALAVSQAIAVTSELTSYSGDASLATTSTTLINAYVSGNYLSPLVNFITSIANNLDILVRLANNAQPAAVPRKSNSSGIGRNYQFEAAWAAIKKANPSIAKLINEEYEAVKELYNSNDDQLNQVGAVITASALPPVTEVFASIIGPMANLINALENNVNKAEAVDAAKKALLASVSQ